MLHLFADFSPGLLQTVDGAAIERRRDLQDAVVVVETAADVSHSDPLLYGAGPRAHISVGHNLRRHQVTHLQIATDTEQSLHPDCTGFNKAGSLKEAMDRTSLKC